MTRIEYSRFRCCSFYSYAFSIIKRCHTKNILNYLVLRFPRNNKKSVWPRFELFYHHKEDWRKIRVFLDKNCGDCLERIQYILYKRFFVVASFHLSLHKAFSTSQPIALLNIAQTRDFDATTVNKRFKLPENCKINCLFIFFWGEKLYNIRNNFILYCSSNFSVIVILQ